MGPNEENQHFEELRQQVCLYIQAVVLLRHLPSLDGKLKRFVTKKGESGCQTRVRLTIATYQSSFIKTIYDISNAFSM